MKIKIFFIVIFLLMTGVVKAVTTNKICKTNYVTAEIVVSDGITYLNLKSKTATLSFPAKIEPTIISNPKGPVYKYVAKDGSAVLIQFTENNSCTIAFGIGSLFMTYVGSASSSELNTAPSQRSNL